MSIHTASEGCSLTQSNVNSLVDATLNVAFDLSRYAYADSNQTCAATSTVAFYGTGFNAQGGIYALQIIDAGIYINYWNSGQVPGDITSGGPNRVPGVQTFFSSTSCTINQYFTDLTLIIDTTLVEHSRRVYQWSRWTNYYLCVFHWILDCCVLRSKPNLKYQHLHTVDRQVHG